MLYFDQNIDESADGNAGFGLKTHTTISDYWGVPPHQRWMNEGTFNGGQLSSEEKKLNSFYETLLSFSSKSAALTGKYIESHSLNRKNTEGYTNKISSFGGKQESRLKTKFCSLLRCRQN